MSNLVISLLATIGACTWIYQKLQNHSGNNTQQSLIATGAIGLLMFVFLLSLLTLII